MAGTDDTVADEDALLVLTAVLLTPAQFPGVLGDDYVAACAVLEPYAEGYGLVLGQDSGGARWTVVVEDVSLVVVALSAWDCGMEYDLPPDGRSVACVLPGWPLALAVAAPGVPEPHDPSPGPDGEGPAPLAPPDTGVWGAPQRRLGADEIALQWAAWRARMDDETVFSRSVEPVTDGVAPADGTRPDETPADSGTAEAVATGQHPGVRKALEAARAYVGSPPRPAGSAPRSPLTEHGRCAPTDPAGSSSPGPTTSRSSCWTRSRARPYRSVAARSCRAC